MKEIFLFWLFSFSCECNPPYLSLAQDKPSTVLSSSKRSDSEICPPMASHWKCPGSRENLLWLLAFGFKRGALFRKSISEHLKNCFMSLFWAVFLRVFFERELCHSTYSNQIKAYNLIWGLPEYINVNKYGEESLFSSPEGKWQTLGCVPITKLFPRFLLGMVTSSILPPGNGPWPV